MLIYAFSSSHGQTLKFLYSEVVLFAQINDDKIIDQIPLIEIKLVREMMDVDDESQKSKNCYDFMIETNPEGYNSGRTYYLRADSYAVCREVSEKISQNSKQAIERDNAKTAFAQAQQQVRKIYKSAIFKNIVACLILTVGNNEISLK